jgi:pectin methylesterase-like acyl-CoA thioesterase
MKLIRIFMLNLIIKNHISRSFIVLLMGILWGGYLSAKTIYVDVNAASATKNGTKLFPYNKIQTGIDSSKSKDTIYVLNGTYSEQIYINQKVIYILGESRDKCIIKSPGSGLPTMRIHSCDSVWVKNFTICWGQISTGEYGSNLDIKWNKKCYVGNVKITDGQNGTASVYVYYSYGTVLQDIEITNNKMHARAFSSDLTIDRSYIHDNNSMERTSGFHVWRGSARMYRGRYIKDCKYYDCK